MKTYVGYIWIDNQPFALVISAASQEEAVRAVEAQCGEGHVVAVWRKCDSPRTKLYVGYVWVSDAPGIRFETWAEGDSEAEAKVVADYGDDCLVFLWNEEDMNKPRRMTSVVSA